jgi:Ca2+-binding RTX toxin-like protein
VRELASRGKERMMRRIILLLMAMAMTLVVASGVAWAVNKIGTDGSDTLWGTSGADNLFGLGGNDKLYALRGSDNLQGGPGNDFVVGGTREGGLGTEYPVGGHKNLFGGDGNDTIFGGKGSDDFLGGAGNDFLLDAGFFKWGNVCCPAGDNLSGGAGKDNIIVFNFRKTSEKDIVSCGSGFDRVVANRNDVLARDCERKYIGQRGVAEFFGF